MAKGKGKSKAVTTAAKEKSATKQPEKGSASKQPEKTHSSKQPGKSPATTTTTSSKKAVNEIDAIFSSAKKRKNPEQQQQQQHEEGELENKSNDPSKKYFKKMKNIGGSKDDLFGKATSKSRKRTSDGFSIYSEEELGLNRPDSGSSPLCPFDCDCCF